MMAVGTRAGLLDEREPAQSFFKHELLRRYLAPFTQKLTRGTDQGVTLVDGYAGRGRYADGTPGSAEHILQAAAAAQPGTTRVELVERDPAMWPPLEDVARDYADRVQCLVSRGTVEDHLDGITQRSAGRHTLFFLDPCGAGLPFSQVVDLARRSYPRTELLMNFNGDLGRRVVAAVLKHDRDSAVLDTVLGTWWRQAALDARQPAADTWEPVLTRLVQDYVRRLAQAARVNVVSIPVRRNLTGQPVFYLIFTTHSSFGIWEMNDAVARTAQLWAKHVGVQQTGMASLFDDDPDTLIDGHARAMEQVRANIVAMVNARDGRRLVDSVDVLFRDAMGIVTSTEIGKLFRDLRDAGTLRLSDDKKLERRRLLYS